MWVVWLRAGGVPKVGGAARDPLLPHAYLQGGCVSRVWGVRRYVCDNRLSCLFREESCKGRRVALLPPPPLPLPPTPLFPRIPLLVCEKNS